MNLANLIEQFKQFDLAPLHEYKHLLSSMTSDHKTIFPPYIPFVGRNFEREKNKILIYAAAQNIPFNDWITTQYSNNLDNLVERLYYAPDFSKKYPDDANFSFADVTIEPYRTGVLPALIGIWLYVNNREMKITDLNEIHEKIAVSNYYKFSLRLNNKDLHPQKLTSSESHNYWRINDELVELELRELKPDVVICFGGRMATCLQSKEYKGYKTVRINDPASIRFKANICFDNITGHTEINELIENYADTIKVTVNIFERSMYKGRSKQIKAYLMEYYHKWLRD